MDQHYQKRNPLGGPAVALEVMAARIRAGEDFYAVLKDCGFSVSDQRSAPYIDPKVQYVGISKLRELSAARLRALDNNALVFQDGDQPLAVMVRWEVYLELQRRALAPEREQENDNV